jgi:hypothetical protein
MKPLKIFPEKNFKEIIEEVGPWHYCIYDKDEQMPGSIFKKQLDIQEFNCVIAGTGCTASSYRVSFDKLSGIEKPEIIIPGGSPIMVVRLLRKDDRHGEVHYNADDQLFFPTKSGDIYRLWRKDAPDHFVNITANSNIRSIAEAYNLPEQKSGPIKKYSAKGAKLHVDAIPLESDSGQTTKL